MEYEFKIRGNESSLHAELTGGFGHADNGLRLRQQLAGDHISAEITDRNSSGSQGSHRLDYDIRADEMASGKSADDIRSGAGEVAGDTGADVAKRDVRGIKVESDSKGIVITGWEAERAVFLNAERARRSQVQAQLESVQVDTDIADGIDSAIGGVATMATISEDEPAPDEDIDRPTDSKALVEEIRRKESLGIHMG